MDRVQVAPQPEQRPASLGKLFGERTPEVTVRYATRPWAMVIHNPAIADCIDCDPAPGPVLARGWRRRHFDRQRVAFSQVPSA